jgi:hypothetical protein
VKACWIPFVLITTSLLPHPHMVDTYVARYVPHGSSKSSAGGGVPTEVSHVADVL